jgi:hypothetical protein
MKLDSRGLATDLMLASMEGAVVEGNGYVVVRTPSCPAFWWGNFILFSRAPELRTVSPAASRWRRSRPFTVRAIAALWCTMFVSTLSAPCRRTRS